MMLRTSEMVQPISVQNGEQEKSPVKLIPKNRRVFYALLFCFVLGMMYGSVLLKSDDSGVLSGLETIQETFIADKSSQSVLQTFLDSALSGSLFLGITFFCGFHALGQPFTFFLLFLRGLGIGSSIGYIYLQYGIQGIGYSFLTILPGAVVSTLALILSGRESVRLSNLLLSCFQKGNSKNKITWKIYLLKHLILLGFILFSAFLDSMTALLFAGLFELG